MSIFALTAALVNSSEHILCFSGSKETLHNGGHADSVTHLKSDLEILKNLKNVLSIKQFFIFVS